MRTCVRVCGQTTSEQSRVEQQAAVRNRANGQREDWTAEFKRQDSSTCAHRRVHDFLSGLGLRLSAVYYRPHTAHRLPFGSSTDNNMTSSSFAVRDDGYRRYQLQARKTCQSQPSSTTYMQQDDVTVSLFVVYCKHCRINSLNNPNSETCRLSTCDIQHV